MSWNWETHRWRNSAKIALGIATIWPIIYMVLFFVVIFSAVGVSMLFEGSSGAASETIDLVQLQTKIRDGDLKELTITRDEIIAVDQSNHHFRTWVTNDSTRAEIIKQARETDSNGRPHVEKIEENTGSQPAERFLPLGFLAIFAVHLFSILLMMGLMPFYIILAVRNDYIDQNMKIMWAVLLCMVNMIAMPVYWYLYIWRKKPPEATLPKPPSPSPENK